MAVGKLTVRQAGGSWAALTLRITPVLSTWEDVQQARAHWKEEEWGKAGPDRPSGSSKGPGYSCTGEARLRPSPCVVA